MGVFDTLRIAASGLTAQRLRMDVASSNIANAETTRTAEGGPYRPEKVVFSTALMEAGNPAARGVVASAIVTNAAGRVVYDPGNPDANAQGLVTYPAVDVAAEMADVIGAQRSYQLDSTVANAAKSMAQDAIDTLGR